MLTFWKILALCCLYAELIILVIIITYVAFVEWVRNGHQQWVREQPCVVPLMAKGFWAPASPLVGPI